MAYRKRAPRRPRRRVAKRKGNRRGRVPKASSQMARISETIEFKSLAPNTVQALTFNIGLFQRARTLATNFRWCKATRCTWSIEPQYNVFAPGTGSTSIPYVYTVMNRTQDSSFMTLNDLLTQGAKPVKLIAMKKTSYRPNWCSPGLLVQNVVPIAGFGGALNNIVMQGLQAQYGWVQCPDATGNPSFVTPLNDFSSVGPQPANTSVANMASSVRYNGHQVYIDQQFTTPVTPTFRITCKVDWVFKDPKNVLANVNDNIFEDVASDLPQGPTGPPE